MFKDWLIVMRKQWSWKNDKINFITSVVVSVLWIVSLLLLENIEITSVEGYYIGLPLLFILIFVVFTVYYNCLKATLLGLTLALVVYCKEKRPDMKDKAQAFYDKALEWKQ